MVVLIIYAVGYAITCAVTPSRYAAVGRMPPDSLVIAMGSLFWPVVWIGCLAEAALAALEAP